MAAESFELDTEVRTLVQLELLSCTFRWIGASLIGDIGDRDALIGKANSSRRVQ